MTNFQEIAGFIWNIADLLRGNFKAHEYADVILPLVVLRRLDAAMEPAREQVHAAERKYRGRLDNLDSVLSEAAGGSAVYNTSAYDWATLLDAPGDLSQNLVAYLNGFSPDVQDVVEKFDFRRQIARLQAADLLYLVLKRFGEINLHPNRVSNHDMGTIFEELIRRFSEQYNETAGEHFTPREVIRLMVQLLFSEDDAVLHRANLIRTIYDPACGTGGMLTEAKGYILEHNPAAQVLLYGQELNPTSYAVAKSDMLLKGENPRAIVFGNSFTQDGHAGQRFNFMLSNPPYGVEWKGVESIIRQEHETRGMRGRFGAGLPRISDGSLLFLQHMLSKRQEDNEGSRIAIVLNGSPLFTGDAGSGESEIRRWIIEHDWLEGIVALPDQLFYNTGIHTYIWMLTNRKSARREGRVQLLDATAAYRKMRKSLGNKRNEIAPEQIGQIVDQYRAFAESENSRIFANAAFGYRKIAVERPLRRTWQATPERLARLEAQPAFAGLAAGNKRDVATRAQEEALGRRYQEQVRAALARLPGTPYPSRPAFEVALKRAATTAGLTLTAPLQKAILAALGEPDAGAEICRDKQGRPEPDPDLRDTESVPLAEDVDAYFAREVRPHVPDAWIDPDKTKVGYEINFNRYFYRYQPLRPLPEIEAEIRTLEQEILGLLREVAG